MVSVAAHEATHAWLMRSWHNHEEKSLFFRYATKFWGIKDFQELVTRDKEGAAARYQARSKAYVNTYAATSPQEDIAEIVEAFIDGRDDQVPKEKVEFLNQDSGFLAFLRNARTGASAFLKRRPTAPDLIIK
jgi:hypothetical protein